MFICPDLANGFFKNALELYHTDGIRLQDQFSFSVFSQGNKASKVLYLESIAQGMIVILNVIDLSKLTAVI